MTSPALDLDVVDHLYKLGLNDETVTFDLLFAELSEHWYGEQALCAALLEDGIRTAQGKPQRWIVHNRPLSCKTRERHGKLIQEAREWIFTRNENAFGFDFCCFSVYLDPDWLRGMIGG